MGGKDIETNDHVQHMKYMDLTEYLTIDRGSTPCVTQLDTNDSLEIYDRFACVEVPEYIYESVNKMLIHVDDLKGNGFRITIGTPNIEGHEIYFDFSYDTFPGFLTAYYWEIVSSGEPIKIDLDKVSDSTNINMRNDS